MDRLNLCVCYGYLLIPAEFICWTLGQVLLLDELHFMFEERVGEGRHVIFLLYVFCCKIVDAS